MRKRKSPAAAGGPLQISAKRVGELALPNCCERCVWLKLRLWNELPYQSFPGVFAAIDSFTKNTVHAHRDNVGKLPDWLAELGAVGYRELPHWSKFRRLVAEHNIVLTGAPDGILVRPDGSFVIVDYKTARLTDGQDDLFPLYEVQLNGYAFIAEKCGFAPVSGLALVYMEPATDPPGGHARQCRPDGFQMGFVARIVNVKLNTALLDPLLSRVRTLHDRPDPPPGCTGCDNCRRVDTLARTALRAVAPASPAAPQEWTEIQEFAELVSRQIAKHPRLGKIRPDSIIAYGLNRSRRSDDHRLYYLLAEPAPDSSVAGPSYFVRIHMSDWNVMSDREKEELVHEILTRIDPDHADEGKVLSRRLEPAPVDVVPVRNPKHRQPGGSS